MPSRSELLRLLTDYLPADPAEQRYRMQMLDAASAAVDPFDRYEYRPGHFTSSGFVLDGAQANVLLIHHAKIGRWLQPGGHIDPTDVSVRAAAQREIREETGVVTAQSAEVSPFDVDVHVFPEGHGQPEHVHFDLRFVFTATEATLQKNHEVHDARWVSLGEVVDMTEDVSVLRPISKLTGDLSSAK